MLAKLINQLWLFFCLSMREEEMIQFSNEIESHPSILLGQLQGEQIRIFKYFRGLKSTYYFVSWVFLVFLRKLSQSLRKDMREYFCSVIFPSASFRGIFHQIFAEIKCKTPPLRTIIEGLFARITAKTYRLLHSRQSFA